MSPFTDKAMIAAFYLKLARNQPTTDEEFLAAAWRLGIVRRLFMLEYGLTENRISEDRGVPEALSWLGECKVDGRFLPLRKQFEQMTQDHVLNYVAKMFKNHLIDWLDKREKRRKKEALAFRKNELGEIIPDYTEPETEVSRIASKAKVKTGRFADYVQWLKDHPSNEHNAQLRMINRELKRRAELWHDDPEVLKRNLAEAIERLVEPLKYCGRNCTLFGAIPVNKTQTLAWAGHHQKPRKRKP